MYHRLVSARHIAVKWLCGVGTAAVLLASSPAVAKPSYSFTPYIWAPSIKGTAALGPVSRPISLSPGKLAKGYRGGGFGRVSADWKGSFLYADGLYLLYGDRSFAPFFGQAVRGGALLAEAGGGLHRSIGLPGGGSVTISPYVGVRYLALKARVNGPALFTGAHNRGVDPVAGVTVEAPVTGKWRLLGKVDGAGFSISDRRHINAEAALVYQANSRVAVIGGYRYAHDVLPSATGLAVDLKGAGPMLGVRYTIW